MSFHRSQTPQSQHFGNFSRFNRNIYSNYNAGQSNSQMDMSSVKQVNPFINNPHGHPAFTPIKSSKAAGDGKGVGGKQPKPPDKPLMPYMRYSRKVSRLVWDSVKANNPDLKLWEIGKVIGQMWRDLSDDQKQEHVDEYEAEKVQYMDAMKVYHNSPAYLSWVASKGKGDGEVDVEEAEKNTRRNKSMREVTDQRIISTVQANEEEDDLEDSYSIKNISAARYHRNHCLINEIFSDALVPDGRTVINEPRMVVLKRQVQSLTMHQKKLENELQLIEDRHVNKKARFHEGSVAFYAELNKLCESKPRISEEQFEQMVSRARDDLNNRNTNNNNIDKKQSEKVEELKEQKEEKEEEEKAGGDGDKELNELVEEKQETEMNTTNQDQENKEEDNQDKKMKQIEEDDMEEAKDVHQTADRKQEQSLDEQEETQEKEEDQAPEEEAVVERNASSEIPPRNKNKELETSAEVTDDDKERSDKEEDADKGCKRNVEA